MEQNFAFRLTLWRHFWKPAL